MVEGPKDGRLAWLGGGVRKTLGDIPQLDNGVQDKGLSQNRRITSATIADSWAWGSTWIGGLKIKGRGGD